MAKQANPKSVFFVCNMNQIRSPMAEFLVRDIFGDAIKAESGGIYVGDEDGFMLAVMKERGIDVTSHQPTSLEEHDFSGVDLIVALTTQAHDATVEFVLGKPIAVEYWPTENPSIAVGNREVILDAYRQTRDELEKRIKERFAP